MQLLRPDSFRLKRKANNILRSCRNAISQRKLVAKLSTKITV